MTKAHQTCIAQQKIVTYSIRRQNHYFGKTAVVIGRQDKLQQEQQQ